MPMMTESWNAPWRDALISSSLGIGICRSCDTTNISPLYDQRISSGCWGHNHTVRCGRHERHTMHQGPSTRSPLTINGPFIRDFLAADSPCFALGLVEERQRQCGFLALRPPTVIPPAITGAGFRFGHSLLGNADFVVVQFVFAFYGFETYNVLVNPNNLLVQ